MELEDEIDQEQRLINEGELAAALSLGSSTHGQVRVQNMEEEQPLPIRHDLEV